MRKIEEKMLEAVRNKGHFNKNNTTVLYHDIAYNGNNISLSEVWLHGNLIYTLNHLTGEETISLCGWNTATTRSRLRALGIPISTVKGCSFYDYHDKGSTSYINPCLIYSILNGVLSIENV